MIIIIVSVSTTMAETAMATATSPSSPPPTTTTLEGAFHKSSHTGPDCARCATDNTSTVPPVNACRTPGVSGVVSKCSNRLSHS